MIKLTYFILAKIGSVHLISFYCLLIFSMMYPLTNFIGKHDETLSD